MKIRLLLFMFCFYGGMALWAQEQSTAILPADAVVLNYLIEAKEYAALYTGKIETPYNVAFENHPYLETSGYVSGTLCYNRVVYQDVLMRFDLFRDEITVVSPDVPHRVVLNNEKFNYAVLHGLTIIKSADEKGAKTKFVVLLHNGTFPVVKKQTLRILEESLSDRTLSRTFQVQRQYVVYVNNIPYAVKNKNSILKLFADRKKELNEYAKQHKLNFKKGIEQSIIEMVTYYENLEERK